MARLTKRESANVGGREFVLCNYKKEDCNDSCMYETNCKWQHKALRKLKEYEDAEEQGFLLRLPIPEGTEVYQIVECYPFGDEGKPFYSMYEEEFNRTMIEKFGKTVFVAKEEAEQALAKMKEV